MESSQSDIEVSSSVVRLSINRVVLSSLYTWLYIRGRDQPKAMAKLRELPSPVMSSSTCL